MALSVDSLSTSYLSSLNSQAQASSTSAKIDRLTSSKNAAQGTTYEELEENMKTFESYLLEQTLKEVKDSLKEIRGDEDDEDPFMSQTKDMYMDQTLSMVAEQMVNQYGARITKDFTDQTARMLGIEIPDEKAANEAAGAAAAAEEDSDAEEPAEEAGEPADAESIS